MQGLPPAAAMCAVHAKLVRDLDSAKADLQRAHETIMAAREQKPMEIAGQFFVARSATGTAPIGRCWSMKWTMAARWGRKIQRGVLPRETRASSA